MEYQGLLAKSSYCLYAAGLRIPESGTAKYYKHIHKIIYPVFTSELFTLGSCLYLINRNKDYNQTIGKTKSDDQIVGFPALFLYTFLISFHLQLVGEFETV